MFELHAALRSRVVLLISVILYTFCTIQPSRSSDIGSPLIPAQICRSILINKPIATAFENRNIKGATKLVYEVSHQNIESAELRYLLKKDKSGKNILVHQLVIPTNRKKSKDTLTEALIKRWLVGSKQHPFGGGREIVLREAQKDGISTGIETLRKRKSFLYVSPTGTGKTAVLSGIARQIWKDYSKKPNVIHLVFAHQVKLVSQLKEALSSAAQDSLLESHDQTADALKSPNSSYVSETIQGFTSYIETLSSAELKQLRERIGLIIFDEAHHIGAPTWLGAIHKILHENSDAKILSATATPVHHLRSIQELLNSTFDGRSFWAYLDHKKDGEGIEREIVDIISQLSQAIDSGELTPLRHFFAANPFSFAKDGSSIFTTNSTIREDLYPDLIKRIASLIVSHDSGFFSVSTVKEAEQLVSNLSRAFPQKNFHLLIGESPNRKLIEQRMTAGEKAFVVSVDLLNEGVNFSQMSLYVDLNSGLGARQLLQRWGRVARLFPGKDVVDIFTLTNWEDADHIADRLALIEAFSSKKIENAPVALKNPRTNTPERTGFQQQRAPLKFETTFVQGAIDLNAPEMSIEMTKLYESMKHIFSHNRNGSPQLRLEDHIINLGIQKIPTTPDTGLYTWVNVESRKPENEWEPSLSEEARAVIKLHRDSRELYSGPQERFEKWLEDVKIADHPPITDNGVNAWFGRLLQRTNTERPNNLSDNALAYIRDEEVLRSKKTGPRERFGSWVNENGIRIPSKQQDGSLYIWIRKLSEKPEQEWPKDFSKNEIAVVRLLRERIESRISPQESFEIWVQTNGVTRVPTSKRSIYVWVMNTAKQPETLWPKNLSESAKAAIRLHKMSKK